ncbi:MAG: RNA polymerase sigma factor [Streptomyces sp.]|uniref:RNA polymerase sigma factor n=1 Tax=Streptomyces sp. TaxID=1931 RepID=UPI0025F36654|nr:RNA polymerase sigma factor [Streptomyces sp.]MBW8800316.1 RNA polymerase sigma factor [Streptomyces sp.]
MNVSLRSRLRAGDPEAFRELFQELAQAVHRHAMRATGDWSTAEEIVSLTFLEVWRLREKLDPNDDSVRPWVYGIATNLLRNRGRAARRHKDAMERMPALDTVPDFSDEVAERLDADHRLTAVKAAVTRLRKNERDVFLLCVWSDLSYAEAADALGVAVGTVRSRLARARKRLHQLTEEELKKQRKAGEPPAVREQIRGDRATAVRSKQETVR